jgi:hypothetical protein
MRQAGSQNRIKEGVCASVVDVASRVKDNEMKVLCWLKLHSWQPDGIWASRICNRCENREVLIYTAIDGAFWERVR